MKKLLLTFALVTLFASLALSQTQTLSFNDNSGTPDAGSYNATDTFSLDVSLTLSGYDTAGLEAVALSYWLQVPVALAPFITITSNTYFTFTDSTQPGLPKTFTSSSGASPGFMTDEIPSLSQSGDLGATANDNTENIGDGTFLMTTLTFSLSGAPAGTFSLLSTTLSPKDSVVGDDDFAPGHAIPAAAYTITIVPEPSSLALLGLGGLAAFGFRKLRRKSAA